MEEILGRIKSLLESENENDINKAYEMYMCLFCNILYNKVMSGFIYEKEDIAILLDYFLEVDDKEKVTNLINILDKYYAGYTNKIFDEYLKEEKYEMCEKMKNFIKPLK